MESIKKSKSNSSKIGSADYFSIFIKMKFFLISSWIKFFSELNLR